MSQKEMQFENMKVADLRKFLESKGLPKNGNKTALIERARSYWNHLQRKQEAQEAKARNAEAEVKIPMLGKDGQESDSHSKQNLEPPLDNWLKTEPMEQVDNDGENGVGGPVATKASKSDGMEHNLESKTDTADIKPSIEALQGSHDDPMAETSTGEPSEVPTEETPNGKRSATGEPSEDPTDVNMSTEETPNGKNKRKFPKRSRKRRRENPGTVFTKLRKVTFEGKNPVQIINEVFQGVKYELVESGDAKSPWFRMRACINGVEYFGDGKSKKEAKSAAAECILRDLVAQLNPTAGIDFTSDDISFAQPEWMCDSTVLTTMRENPDVNMSPPPAQPTPPAPAHVLPKPKEEDIHPVMLLNQKIPGLQYDITPLGKSFQACITLNEVQYCGQGRNKKLAKYSCAVKALKGHFGIHSQQGESLMPVPSSEVCEEEDIPPVVGNLPDFVSDIIKIKFAQLTEGNDRTSQHKVLAGIVMTRTADLDINDGKVICVATGTKCISGEYISSQGTALNDCHAEIVCRRGLRRYLYHQLLSLARNEESVFEKCEDGDRGYQLKNDVFFHLFISTSPCGDGRVFSPHESEKMKDDHPNRFSRGQLRTKIEAGEGTIPVQQHHSLTADGLQLWDSVIGGERLLTMSCSDKLARWNLLGLQGALLTLFIKPVYYSSVVLGSLFHGSHLSRGLYTRIQNAVTAVTKDNEIVKLPYKIHRPLLAPISSIVKRKPVKAPNFCLHWTIGDDAPTIIDTVTGKCQDDTSSNLCKMEMLALITKVLQSDLVPRVDIPTTSEPRGYSDIKKLAEEYQNLKWDLYRGFKEAGLGIWVKKPEEVDSFRCAPEN